MQSSSKLATVTKEGRSLLKGQLHECLRVCACVFVYDPAVSGSMVTPVVLSCVSVCVCVDQCQRPLASELHRATAFGTQLPSAEHQTWGETERTWLGPWTTNYTPAPQNSSRLLQPGRFPNHLSCLSITPSRQSSFHLNTYSSSTRASLSEAWSKITPVHRAPHSCPTLVLSSRFSLSNQSKKRNEENWFEHVLVCFIYFLTSMFLLATFFTTAGKSSDAFFPLAIN